MILPTLQECCTLSNLLIFLTTVSIIFLTTMIQVCGKVCMHATIASVTDTFNTAGIPPDGTPVQVVDSIQPLLAVVVSIVSGTCITFSLLCCAFMLIFRNRKLVFCEFECLSTQ